METWHVPGLSGQAGLLLGFSDGDFAFRAVLYDVHSNVVAWHQALQALQGAVVSIVDDFGGTHGGCLVVRVGELERRAAFGPGYDTRGEVTVEGVKVA
ncbi:MAG: hypothetical protein KF878_00070 [Planctomycetes bacterium]|nr:hypothetical protein [Planctomycetota bacterium]